jgi:hypothetical protein
MNDQQIVRDAQTQGNGAKNKTLVLEAFDTLFNKRDYAAAERLKRRVYSYDAEKRKIPDPVLVAIDVHAIAFSHS